MQARNIADKERMVKRQRWVYCSVFGCFNGGRRTASCSDASLIVVVLCYGIHAARDQGSMQAPEGGLLLPLCGLQTFCHGG